MRYVAADKIARKMELKEIELFLSKPLILRLAMVDDKDNNSPLVHPLWYYYENEKFFLSTERDGRKANSLRKNNRIYFLVDTDNRPPAGVRGKGTAKVIDDAEYATRVTIRNISRYIGSLDGKVAQDLIEIAKSSSVIEISPKYIASWSY
jgi:nitroimidazol reductase NimA-like FMN-containing flavoprotein (pyridoxamine 5'-phosphate oxidase superfamily)